MRVAYLIVYLLMVANICVAAKYKWVCTGPMHCMRRCPPGSNTCNIACCEKGRLCRTRLTSKCKPRRKCIRGGYCALKQCCRRLKRGDDS